MPNVVQPPSRLQPDTPLKDNLAYLNNNFDNIVTSINDIGGKLFSGASYSASIAPGYMNTATVNVVDTLNQYVAGSTPVMPIVKIYVDVDNDDNMVLGIPNSLTSGQADAMVSTWVLNGYTTGTVANYTIQITNRDAIDAHVYYVYVNQFTFQSPTTRSSGDVSR